MVAIITPTPPALAHGDLGSLIILSSAPGGTFTSNEVENLSGARGVVIGINFTQIGGSPTLVVTLQGVDKASGQVYTLLASPTISSNGFTTLTIFPGETAVANVAANAELPACWQVSATVAGSAPALSGTISASLLY